MPSEFARRFEDETFFETFFDNDEEHPEDHSTTLSSPFLRYAPSAGCRPDPGFPHEVEEREIRGEAQSPNAGRCGR